VRLVVIAPPALGLGQRKAAVDDRPIGIGQVQRELGR